MGRTESILVGIQAPVERARHQLVSVLPSCKHITLAAGSIPSVLPCSCTHEVTAGENGSLHEAIILWMIHRGTRLCGVECIQRLLEDGTFKVLPLILVWDTADSGF